MPSIEEFAAQQRAYWNGEGGEPWIRTQDERDRSLAPIGALAREALAPAPGMRVLDIGCGCGGTSFELADAVGADGYVLGSDISETMLAVAEQRRRDMGLEHVRFQAGDATDATFAGAPFDAVFSRFGVMFFADPDAAFRNIRDAMKPGGRMAFVAWRRVEDNPWVYLARQVVLRHVPAPEPPAPDAPGQFAFADSGRVERILGGAGFSDIELAPRDLPFTVTEAGDMETALKAVTTRGPSGRLLADAGDDVIDRVRAELAPMLEPHLGPDGLRLGSAVWVVTARAP